MMARTKPMTRRERSLDEQPSQIFRLLRASACPDLRSPTHVNFERFAQWVRGSDRRLELLEIAVAARGGAENAEGVLLRAESFEALARSIAWK